MSFLSGLMGSMLQQQGDSPLARVAAELLRGNGEGGGGGGGLSGILDAFRNAGLDEQLQSWISTGRNIPISSEQLKQALGSDRIQDIAGRLGMSDGEVTGGLADLLPQLIDKLTPNGELPQDQSMIDCALAMFTKRG